MFLITKDWLDQVQAANQMEFLDRAEQRVAMSRLIMVARNLLDAKYYVDTGSVTQFSKAAVSHLLSDCFRPKQV